MGNIEKITVIVRDIIEDWKEMEEKHPEYHKKINFIVKENFDDMSDLPEKLEGYDAFICCLSSASHLHKNFYCKPNYFYPIEFAKIAKQLNVPYFSYMSEWIVDITSTDMMRKVKAMTEQEISKIGLNHLTIFRPRPLTNAYGKNYHIYKGMVALN